MSYQQAVLETMRRHGGVIKPCTVSLHTPQQEDVPFAHHRRNCRAALAELVREGRVVPRKGGEYLLRDRPQRKRGPARGFAFRIQALLTFNVDGLEVDEIAKLLGISPRRTLGILNRMSARDGSGPLEVGSTWVWVELPRT